MLKADTGSTASAIGERFLRPSGLNLCKIKGLTASP